MHLKDLARFLVLLTALIASFVDGLGVDPQTARLIDQEIQKHNAEFIRTRRFLHMNPELRNREFETARLIASKLLSSGLEVKSGVAGTGVTGLLRGADQGLTIGLRAEMDALPIQELTDLSFKSLNPGIMHASGHDIHVAIALGTAQVMSTLKEKISGNLKFIFQPAEEGASFGNSGGAKAMIQEGVLENPPVQAIFGFHVWPENIGQAYYSPGPIMASSDEFQIIIEGKSSLAARPHEGIDAIALASQVIVNIQSIASRSVDPTDPVIVTIGKIAGGTRANVIAEKATIDGTIRTLSEVNRKKIPRLIEDIVRGATQSFGASYIFHYQKGAPPLYNHPDLASILAPTLSQALGKGNVHDIKPQMVSEDFSYFSQKIPGFYFFLGVKNPEKPSIAPLNSPYFNPDERCISLGIKIMCHLLIDCLEHQRHIGGIPRP